MWEEGSSELLRCSPRYICKILEWGWPDGEAGLDVGSIVKAKDEVSRFRTTNFHIPFLRPADCSIEGLL